MERGRLGAERRLSVRRTQVVQVLVHNQGPSAEIGKLPGRPTARPPWRGGGAEGNHRSTRLQE